jgi:exopolysaccharide biosynthesis protein
VRFAALLLCLPAVASATPARVSQTDPHPGIHVEKWADAAIPATMTIVSIDLTSQELAVYATAPADRGITTGAYATKLAGQVAINGDSFDVATFAPRGLAMGNSMLWTNTADDATSSVLRFGRAADTLHHELTDAEIIPAEVVVDPTMLASDTQGIVSGRPLLVRAGVVATQFDCDDASMIACERAPRAAVALSANKETMWLVTVDGWQSGSLGMTDAELAAFIQARGADMAFGLDSASSSTLILDDVVANKPSDGVQRAVANHLGIKYGALPHGNMVGVICKHDVTLCTDPNNTSARIPGAKVTLDDGRSMTVGSDAFYTFDNITPRVACVTVKATGYLSKTQCNTVESGVAESYNSVALDVGTDPKDAGVMDAPADDDAGPIYDGHPAHDAGGNPAMGPGGGCCDAGGDRPTPALALLVGWFLTRRRGIVPTRG